MFHIGYTYKSALETEIHKLVLCKDETEYRKMKERIEDAGYKPIEFTETYKASRVIHESS